MIVLDEKGNVRPGTNHLRRSSKHSTENREVTMIQEWYKYMLMPKVPYRCPGSSRRQSSKRMREMPILLSLHRITQRSIDVSVHGQRRKESHAHKPEWRQVVFLLFLISTNVGWRPDSEGLVFTWDRMKLRKRRTTLLKGEEKIEYVVNLRIWDRKNKQ